MSLHAVFGTAPAFFDDSNAVSGGTSSNLAIAGCPAVFDYCLPVWGVLQTDIGGGSPMRRPIVPLRRRKKVPLDNGNLAVILSALTAYYGQL